MAEKKIKNLNDLYNAAINKKSVVCPDLAPWWKPHPAGFMMNLQGTVLYRCFKHGSGMYLYNKKEK